MRFIIFVPLGTGDARQLGERIGFRDQGDQRRIGIFGVQAGAKTVGEVGDGVIGHARTRRLWSSAVMPPTNIRARHYPGLQIRLAITETPTMARIFLALKNMLHRHRRYVIANHVIDNHVIDNQGTLAMIPPPERGMIAAKWVLRSKFSASSSFSARMCS
jgi:hypothetical protein